MTDKNKKANITDVLLPQDHTVDLGLLREAIDYARDPAREYEDLRMRYFGEEPENPHFRPTFMSQEEKNTYDEEVAYRKAKEESLKTMQEQIRFIDRIRGFTAPLPVPEEDNFLMATVRNTLGNYLQAASGIVQSSGDMYDDNRVRQLAKKLSQYAARKQSIRVRKTDLPVGPQSPVDSIRQGASTLVSETLSFPAYGGSAPARKIAAAGAAGVSGLRKYSEMRNQHGLDPLPATINSVFTAGNDAIPASGTGKKVISGTTQYAVDEGTGVRRQPEELLFDISGRHLNPYAGEGLYKAAQKGKDLYSKGADISVIHRTLQQTGNIDKHLRNQHLIDRRIEKNTVPAYEVPLNFDEWKKTARYPSQSE